MVTSYCPRPKLPLKPSYFPRAFRPEGNMRVSGVGLIFGRGQRYHSAINSTSARNKQSIFVLLSDHQKCTLLKLLVCIFHESLVRTEKYITISTSPASAGSPVHLLAYFSLWRIHGVQWMTILWHFWYYLTVKWFKIFSTSSSVSVMKPMSSVIW